MQFIQKYAIKRERNKEQMEYIGNKNMMADLNPVILIVTWKCLKKSIKGIDCQIG